MSLKRTLLLKRKQSSRGGSTLAQETPRMSGSDGASQRKSFQLFSVNRAEPHFKGRTSSAPTSKIRTLSRAP